MIFVASIIVAPMVVGAAPGGANTVTGSTFVTGGICGHEGVALWIYYGVFKHYVSNSILFTSWDPGVTNVTFNADAGTTSVSRDVGTVKFEALYSNRDQCIDTLDDVTHQPHNLVAVGQLTRSVEKQ